MFNFEDALKAAEILEINFNDFSIDDFLNGINVELEHGSANPETNITNDDLILTSKIALAHLNEYPNYYNNEYGISKFENFLKSKKN